jgi:hypothetical protein
MHEYHINSFPDNQGSEQIKVIFNKIEDIKMNHYQKGAKMPILLK